jgi:large subunit ribosomal protein L25
MAYTFDAEIRTDLGKGASRRQRREDKVPAVVYGGNKEAVSISLDHKKIFIAQQSEDFYKDNITLNIGGEPVLVKVVAIQRHPVKQRIVHLDFLRQ